MLDEADERARQVLAAQRAHLDRLAEMLVLRETMERHDLEAVLGDLPSVGPTPPPPAAGPDRPTAPARAR